MRLRYFLVLGILLSALPAYCWQNNTHLQMTRDAVALMPPEFQKMLTEHQKFVEQGIRDPDEVIKDWPNHLYIAGTGDGGGIDRIEKIIAVIQSRFGSSSPTDVSKQLCYLAHYIGDLWTPAPYLRQALPNDNNFVKNNEIIVFWEGYQKPIENWHDYFVQRSKWRWRLEDSKALYPLLYSEAVNDIARAWLTLWQQSGHTLDPQKPSLIVHKAGSLNVNYTNLLIMEDVYWYENYSFSVDPEGHLESQVKENQRLRSEVAPGPDDWVARREARKMIEANPDAPFKMLESSLVTLGDKAYFVARVRNQSKATIGSLAFMIPGVRGPFWMIKNLNAGEVAKVDTVLPAGATKDQIQAIYASPGP
jgi:hypothetical protein